MPEEFGTTEAQLVAARRDNLAALRSRGNDPFAHFSEMDAAGFKSLQENHEVSFDVKSRRTGKQAASTMPYRAFHAERPMSAGWSMSAATVGPMPVAWRATTCYLARTAGQAV